MVIDFPTVARGGAPATEEGAPENGAAFASLVDGLLAEEPARPDDDGDADIGHDNELPPPDGAAFLLALPTSVGNVPSLAGLSSTPDDIAAPSSQQGPFGSVAGMAGAAGAQAAGHHRSAGFQPGGPGSAPGVEWPRVGPVSSDAAPAFGATGAAASRPHGAEPVSESPSGVSGAGALLPVPSGSPTDWAGDGGPQGSTTAPAASATRPPVDTTLAGFGEAPEGDVTARRHARGDVDQPWTSPFEPGQSHADAAQRAGAVAEQSPDLGSSARDGSREGGAPGPFQTGAHVAAAGATPTSAAGALLSAAGGHASPADDVVLPQLVRAMRLQVTGGVGEARIQLDPAHLGAVTVSLRVEGGVVSAVVTAEQAGVRQWIESHEASLRQALAEQGLLLERLHVQRDGRPPGEHASRGQDDTPRRRAPRKDTATFELLA